MKVLAIYYIFINFITYIVYWRDKQRARKRTRRIPEKKLLTLAAIGGAVGAYLGMNIFHHKTQKIWFRVFVPTMILVHLTVAIILLKYI